MGGKVLNVDSGMNSDNLEKGYLIQMVVRNIKNHLENKQNQAVNEESKTDMKNTAVKPKVKQSLRTDITTEIKKVYLTEDVLKELVKGEIIKACDELEFVFKSVVASAANIAGKRFVEMKNFPVWYDSEQSILFSNKIYGAYMDSDYADSYIKKINKKIGKLVFKVPSRAEFTRSFGISISNPLVKAMGCEWRLIIPITAESPE